MKSIYLGITLVLLVGLIWLVLVATKTPSSLDNPVGEGTNVISDGQSPEVEPVVSTSTPDNNLPTQTFSGPLEVVDTGCFADGECFVVVDGKHVTTIVGRRNEPVGDILNVSSFGDLERYLGDEVEVYAQDLGGNNFTLYGDADFYLKVVNGGGVTIALGQSETFLDVEFTPLRVTEDSRCPREVMCIQAGTVKVETKLKTNAAAYEQIFTLNEPVTMEKWVITLVQVNPEKISPTESLTDAYSFHFKVIQK